MDAAIVASLITLVASVLGPLIGHMLGTRRKAQEQQKSTHHAVASATSASKPDEVGSIDIGSLVPTRTSKLDLQSATLGNFVIRGIAFFIDFWIVALLPMVGFAVASFDQSLQWSEDELNLIFGAYFYGSWIVYSVAGWSRWGTTIGKRIFGYYVVSTDGRIGIPPGRAFMRFVGYIVGIATMWLGYLLALMNPQRRALHDYLGASYVVRMRAR